MPSSQRTTPSQKQAICKKLISVLKKHYKQPIPKHTRPVLETIVYAVCQENVSIDDADTAYKSLETKFHDLNEIRVSSINELESAFRMLDEPEWRALRVRSTLQYVFEKYFVFEFEVLRKKTLELATKQLRSIDTLTPFVRNYVLHAILGSHVVPLDTATRNASVWLGLVSPEMDVDAASESLKQAVRKADVSLFCHLLRCLATDPKMSGAFAQKALAKKTADDFDASTSPERVQKLLKSGYIAPKKTKSHSSSADDRKKVKAAKPRGQKTSPPKAAGTKAKTGKKGTQKKTGSGSRR